MARSNYSENYNNYLKNRSKFGLFYRNRILYPKLTKYLNGRTLDYGCGIGDFLSYKLNSVGVDINSYNIDYCQSLGLDAKLIQGSSLPFTDCYFDNVIMDNVIEHIQTEEIAPVLEEIIRVLKPKGNFLIGVPGFKGYQSDSDHKVYYTENTLTDLIAKHHINKIKSIHMPIHLIWLGKILSQYCIYILFRNN